MPPEWSNLVLAIVAGLIPCACGAGLRWGRMQVEDEIDRGEHPRYVNRRVPVRILHRTGGRRHRTITLMEDA